MRAEALALLLAFAGGGAPATPAADADADIHALINALAASPCKFQRNGSWYDGTRAAAHLQRKYDYLQKRDQAGTPEQFIDRAASRSSISGRPYRVACPGQPERDAAAWFREQLQAQRRHRAGT